MTSIACVTFGYIIGLIVAWFIYSPTKAFDKGYEAAKEFYGDWEKGFDNGWEACKKAYTEALKRDSGEGKG